MKIWYLTLFLEVLCIALGSPQSLAVVIGDFSFNIISEEEKTVEVSLYFKTYTTPVIYDLKIPSIVEIEGEEYQVVAIKKNGFRDTKRIYNTIEIPSSVKIIGDEAFSWIKNVDEIILHEGLDSIGKSAFKDASIKKMNIPSTAINLGEDIFAFTDLQEIGWPENLNSIPSGCFWRSNLTRFDFGNIKYIGSYAFSGCQYLDDITIPYGCNLDHFAFREYGGKNITFEGCPGDLPDSFDDNTLISSDVFLDCFNLKRIELPRGLKIIGPRAFMGCCDVETIVIHEDVDFSCGEIFVGHIEWDSWGNPYYYKDLIPDSIIYLADNPMVQPDIFQDLTYLESPLYVKPEALEKVRNTYPWSKFRNIVALSSGIDDLPADTDDGQNSPDLFYNLEGIPCGSDRNALPRGIYILRKNGKTSKIVI